MTLVPFSLLAGSKHICSDCYFFVIIDIFVLVSSSYLVLVNFLKLTSNMNMTEMLIPDFIYIF
jgi:hypothetical protein